MLLGVCICWWMSWRCARQFTEGSIGSMLWNGETISVSGTEYWLYGICGGSCYCCADKIETREGCGDVCWKENEYSTRSTKTWTLWCSEWYSGRQISILGQFQELFRVGPLRISGGSVWEGLNWLKCAHNLTLGGEKNIKEETILCIYSDFYYAIIEWLFWVFKPCNTIFKCKWSLRCEFAELSWLWRGTHGSHGYQVTIHVCRTDCQFSLVHHIEGATPPTTIKKMSLLNLDATPFGCSRPGGARTRIWSLFVSWSVKHEHSII